ncbi:MAG: tRNA (N(6)-L-threonylcarbamoyladenosine(37)-C(2))-methylthiotransferase MtaB [Erysipelotrichaceae bacterium]|nr:tRNA (N(6)-L-threonylcarbamoyladenosine(37)-C(2))-methylthiotransferase MtaB [Erysipelotrichaceae bacterium]
MKVRAITLGCKVNTYESEYILSCFKDKGYEITNDIADIYIVNTCSVTNMSDAKSRKVIHRLVRENKNSVIVVMGCMIEANKDIKLDGVSIIIGNKDKAKVVELVEAYLKDREQKRLLYENFDSTFEDMFITNMESRHRAFVKIEDGCENFCSYCIIPYTRGRVRSKNPDTVIKEITTLVKNGYKEVVLTGIHTGHYGSDIETSFPELLKEIVKIEGLERLRISSIEITELNDEFLNVLKNNSVIVSHLHIPLQAGSDKILTLMNRKYLTPYFLDKVEKIREIRPDISLTTDVIVGFPGETEEDFLDTINFCKKIKFTKIHVFPYSRRKGTKADLMDEQIPENIKKERVKRLIDVSNNLEKEYLDSFISKTVSVLIEEDKDGYSIGHTGNYLKVKILGDIKANEIVSVKIKERENLELVGEYEKDK